MGADDNNEISKLHGRIDDLVKAQNETNVMVARIETKLEMMPPPLKQPCVYHDNLEKEFEEHIESHKEVKTLWCKPAIGVAFDFVKMAIVAVVTWLFLRKDGN